MVCPNHRQQAGGLLSLSGSTRELCSCPRPWVTCGFQKVWLCPACSWGLALARTNPGLAPTGHPVVFLPWSLLPANEERKRLPPRVRAGTVGRSQPQDKVSDTPGHANGGRGHYSSSRHSPPLLLTSDFPLGLPSLPHLVDFGVYKVCRLPRPQGHYAPSPALGKHPSHTPPRSQWQGGERRGRACTPGSLGS